MTDTDQMETAPHDKSHRGNASQFFIAGELCRRGVVAVVTMGNSPNTDILCSNAAGTRFAHIQVKTFIPGTRTCSVGLNAAKSYGDNFFWVLGGIPEPGSDGFQYYIIPAREMAKNISECFDLWLKAPGKDGPHDPENKIRTVHLPPRTCRNGWDITPYLNKWETILKCLEVEAGT